MHRDRDIKTKNTQREKGKKDRDKEIKKDRQIKNVDVKNTGSIERIKKHRQRERDGSVQVNQFLLSFLIF